MYIYERSDWPDFRWQEEKIAVLLADVRHIQGRLLGRMDTLGFKLREDATIATLTQDVLKTSEIEGEKLDTDQVRSSIAKRLGILKGKLPPIDRNVEGIVEVMLDATRHYALPLTSERLFKWHTALFPTGGSHFYKITVGQWRTKSSGPMQIVSGTPGREKIHYEAPAYHKLKTEMTTFIKWFNADSKTDFILKSAIAHFWFVTIHPFDDGNGRIARAIADMLLARSDNSDKRFFSMSTQIQKERKAYYDVLEKSQKGALDITLWLEWYLTCLKQAILASESLLENILIKAKFWQLHASDVFNDRQRIIMNLLLDDFNGKLTTTKWAKITKCSQDTALRDITDLMSRKILAKDESGGRSTSYYLVLSKLNKAN